MKEEDIQLEEYQGECFAEKQAEQEYQEECAYKDYLLTPIKIKIAKEIQNLDDAQNSHIELPDQYSEFWLKCIPEIRKAYMKAILIINESG